MATGHNTFDGVSHPTQKGKKCTLYLQLGDLQTEKKLVGPVKPKNCDSPVREVTDQSVSVTATLTVDGRQDVYVWDKTHNGKITKCDVGFEKGQLKVTLTKPDGKDWPQSFIEYLQEI